MFISLLCIYIYTYAQDRNSMFILPGWRLNPPRLSELRQKAVEFREKIRSGERENSKMDKLLQVLRPLENYPLMMSK